MRSMNSWAASALALGLFQVGCSSDDSARAPALVPQDGGPVAVPDAAATPGPVLVQVQGHGTVASSDAQEGDAGFSGSLVCTPTSVASQCTARQRTTLYAVADIGWVVARWTTSGLAETVDLGSHSDHYEVGADTPSPLIVIFSPQSVAPVPVDAGGGD